MKRSHAKHALSAPVDIVGIPEPHLREHLEHILEADSVHGTEPPSLLGLARHLPPEDHLSKEPLSLDETEGHEDMLPQLRLLNALLNKANGEAPRPERRPFADVIAAEQYRRQRRKRLSRRGDAIEELPPPSPQAENDRLLLEEIGRKPAHPNGGWIAEPQQSAVTPVVSPELPTPPPSYALGDEVMDNFVGVPVSLPQAAQPGQASTDEPAKDAPPPIPLKIKRKEKPTTAADSGGVPQDVDQPSPQSDETARPTVKMRVKGKPRRHAAEAPLPAEPVAATEAPEAPAEPEAKADTKPAIRMKVKGKPRRHLAEALPPAEPVAAAEAPKAPAEPETEAVTKPTVSMKVKGKPRRHLAEALPPAKPVAAAEAPEAPAEPETEAIAKPAVRMKVKGKPRRHAAEASPPAEPVAAAETPEAPAEPEAVTKPAVRMKVKGKPRRHAAEASPPAEPVAAAPEAPAEPEAEAVTKPTVSMKVKGKPRRHAVEAPAPSEVSSPVAESVAESIEIPPAEMALSQEVSPPPSEAAPEAVPQEDQSSVAEDAPTPSVEGNDPLQQRVEAVIAAHTHRAASDAPLRGSMNLPENREALAKLLDDVQPASDFDALDLVYACWGKNTHDSDSRALLAVAQQISRHFGLPDKLPMASTKAWKMLDNKVFAPELADRLAAVGQFIVDWQKTQRVFLILEFSEIELIEYLFEALSPADYPELLAEVMNFKVLSNRRMGLLRRFPARLRKQTQPMLPDHKEEALVIQAHGKALLQKIADPRGFAPIVELAGKMLEEVEKLMKQTANSGAPPQLGGPPGGGGALGRIG